MSKYICLDCQTYSTPKCVAESHIITSTGTNLRLPKKTKDSEWRDLRRIFLAWEERRRKILAANPNARVDSEKIIPGFGGSGGWSWREGYPKSIREKNFRANLLAWASSSPFRIPFPKAVRTK